MPRDLKPHVIEQISSDREDCFDVPLCFDRNKKVFFVEYELERVEHTDLKECRKLGREMLGRVNPYKWEPFIEVFYVSNDDHNTHYGGYVGEMFAEHVNFTFRRFERSHHPTQRGKFVSRWMAIDKPTGWEARVREWSGYDECSKILPYTEETWAGLLAIHEAMRGIKSKLHHLVLSRQLGTRLRAIALSVAGGGELLLTEGKKP